MWHRTRRLPRPGQVKNPVLPTLASSQTFGKGKSRLLSVSRLILSYYYYDIILFNNLHKVNMYLKGTRNLKQASIYVPFEGSHKRTLNDVCEALEGSATLCDAY